MGAGANCSYTDTAGVFVHLICNSTDCCDASSHTCSASTCSSSSGVSLNTYLFWVILAGSALFTVLVLLVSYALCRYRKPGCGCADAGAARDRFLEENILAATLSRTELTHSLSTSPTSITPATSSPVTGHTPSDSPDLLVHKPLTRAPPNRSMIPVKKVSKSAVNKAFILGAEAFARKSIAVQRAVVAEAGAGAAAAHAMGQRAALDCDVNASGAASPRLVQLGGFTPRVNLRDKGRTESKQTIISSDTDSMTTVGS